MKVLMLNGSSRPRGCTYTALSEVAASLKENGVDSEIVFLGNAPVRDCIACEKCAGLDNACVFDDDIVNQVLRKAEAADGFIFASPVYYAHPTGRLLSVLDRAFYAASDVFAYKPGAAVVSARRAGTTASLDVINKYFTIADMPVVSSTYWNMVHGNTPEEVRQDLEGLQTMRNIGRNMAWLLRCLEAGRAAGVAAPKPEHDRRTNFIR